MSEEIAEVLKESQEPQPAPASEEDWLLQLLVNMANDGVSFDITLQVGGFAVSGILIGGKKYFEELGAQFASGFNNETAEQVKNSFAQQGNNIYKTDEDEEPLPPPSFIHLSNARCYHNSGQPIPANHGVLWRGRISEVSAFWLGSLKHGGVD